MLPPLLSDLNIGMVPGGIHGIRVTLDTGSIFIAPIPIGSGIGKVNFMTGVFMISTIAVRAAVGIKGSIAVKPRTAPALMTDGAAAAMTGADMEATTGVDVEAMTGADTEATTEVDTGAMTGADMEATTGADMEAATANRSCLPG